MDVEARLERLERQSRDMKRTLLACSVIAVGLVGLVVVGIGVDIDREVPEVIEARAFRVVDENGMTRAVMDADGFGYADENGTTRARLGPAELVTPATGSETRYPAAVVLFEDEGNVLWKQP